MERKVIPITNEIKAFFHCGKCIEDIKFLVETKGNASPRAYAQLEVGWTVLGLQVWCKRHECNVISIDFEGQKHPANISQGEE